MEVIVFSLLVPILLIKEYLDTKRLNESVNLLMWRNGFEKRMDGKWHVAK